MIWKYDLHFSQLYTAVIPNFGIPLLDSQRQDDVRLDDL